ncbi:MAG TPA: hypothetical protein VLQ65_10850 [Saliniramus sp.]|nr:hypothetical protein [Saliniramus sp.]
MEVSGGYLWAISTVLIPILLALAMIYASYQTWQYRKHTRYRPERMPNEVLEPEDAARVEQSVRRIIVWSVISCILLVAVIVIFFW